MNSPTRLAALLAVPALFGPVLHAQSPASAPQNDEQYQGENPDRYAMVRSLDGDVRITKGDVQDTLQKGTPVGEGDVVDSSGRGVLQLADGTRIAFDRNTRFTVASLFKDQNGSRQVLLRLDRGRLRVRMDSDSDARVRIDTPSSSVSSSDRATFNVEVDTDGVARVAVRIGHVRVSNQRDDASLGAGEQIAVFGAQDKLNRIRAFNTYDQDDFDRWSDGAWTVKRGASWDRVPSELRYYSDDLDQHGSWVYSDEYGWVWKPEGVASNWRPYYDGRWAAYPGGMTWISYDPWAYVTYHHGRWAWSAGGWFWIPGLYYSPAWVAWSYNDGYAGWAPLGYYNTPCTWGYGAWGGGYCWNVVSINYINVRYVNRYCAYDRNVISTFNRGTGASSWSPNRGLGAPWRTRPLMASNSEFRNPTANQFHRAFQPGVERERFAAYQQRAATTGRQVYFRPASTGAAASGSPNRGGNGAGPGRIPFEDRSQLNRQSQDGPATRGNAGNGRPDQGGRPGNTGGVDNRRDALPGRGFENRPGPGNDRRSNDGPTNSRESLPVRGFENRPQPGNDRPAEGNNQRRDSHPVRGFENRPQPGGDSPTDNNRRQVPDRAPDRTPDRSFERDFDRPAPRREAPPVREAPPMREAPRNENRQPAPQRQERPSNPPPSQGGEGSRGNPGGRGGAPWRR